MGRARVARPEADPKKGSEVLGRASEEGEATGRVEVG